MRRTARGLMTIGRSIHMVTIKRRHTLKLTNKAKNMSRNGRVVNFSADSDHVRHLVKCTVPRIDSDIGTVNLRVRRMFRTQVVSASLLGHLYTLRITNGNSNKVSFLSSTHNLANKVNLVSKRGRDTSYHTDRVDRAPLVTNEQMGRRRNTNFSTGSRRTLNRLACTKRRFDDYNTTPLINIIVLPFHSSIVQHTDYSFNRRQMSNIIVNNSVSKFFCVFARSRCCEQADL